MKMIRTFLLGLVTAHIGTKFLALVLSVVLFLFVQQTNQEREEIPELILTFKLAPDVERTHVLITPEVSLENVTITGLHARVDPVVTPLRQNQGRMPMITINDAFLRRYLRKDDRAIPVDRNLLRDPAILTRDLDVELKQTKYIEIEPRVEHKHVYVPMDPDQELKPPAGFPFLGEGAGGGFIPNINVKQVTLSGPGRTFRYAQEFKTLYLEPIDLRKAFKEFEPSGPMATFAAKVNWAKSGIDLGSLRFLRILAEELSPKPMTAEEFERKITVSFAVSPAVEPRDLEIPIDIRTHKGEYDLKKYELQPFLIKQRDFEARKTNKFQVMMPERLWANTEFQANLVLVLDVAAARARSQDEIAVPIYLDLRDRTKPGHLESLRQVTIVTQGQAAELYFKKK